MGILISLVGKSQGDIDEVLTINANAIKSQISIAALV